MENEASKEQFLMPKALLLRRPWMHWKEKTLHNQMRQSPPKLNFSEKTGWVSDVFYDYRIIKTFKYSMIFPQEGIFSSQIYFIKIFS